VPAEHEIGVERHSLKDPHGDILHGIPVSAVSLVQVGVTVAGRAAAEGTAPAIGPAGVVRATAAQRFGQTLPWPRQLRYCSRTDEFAQMYIRFH